MDQELKILLVEDDPDTRANLVDILELDGHDVETAGTARLARESVLRHTFEIIILDRKLPDARADELLPELVELNPDAHVIVMTGYANLNSTIAAFRAGAADYLIKPVNVDALRNSLQHIQRTHVAEMQLKQEQEFANLILDTADAIILVLDLEGVIVQVNDYFQRISGWDQSELIGQDWFEKCIPTRERDRVQQVFLQTARELVSRGIVNPILTKHGTERQIRWSNNTIPNGDDSASAVLAVGIDVTDHIAAEQQLRQAERLAGIGQTMAAIAHESRNGLQRIHAGVEMLEEITRGDPEAQPDLLVIKRAANDLNLVFEEVRSFAAPIHLHLDECDLSETIRHAWSSVVEASQGIEASLNGECLSDLLPIQADGFRIEQVFRNLFENAIAACEGGVEINVEAYRSDGWCRVVVKDNGPGLSHEQQQRIFEPFYTTKAKGTGLGMAIAKRVLDAHQGTIRALPRETARTGAAFEICLPVKQTGRKRLTS